ncbi:hypothetical protein, partial [Pedobacter nototheniae]|uniref:hypothetical protein n=1 Tax=Pedobacter nototheniae TaxID=2488994 RepID=UPI0013F3EA74
ASGTITYVDPKVASGTLIDKKDISTDGIVLVNGLSGLSSSVLVNAKLSIAPNSITSNEISNGALTLDKISGPGEKNRVLGTDVNGAVKWTTVEAITKSTTNDLSLTGVNLTSNVSGVSSTVNLTDKLTGNMIQNNTITSDKIKVDAGAVTGMIPIVGASGTITYVDPKTTSNTLI